MNGVTLGTALKQVHALPSVMHLPQGVHLIEIGDAQVMGELFVNFSVAMTTGILMVFAVLVLLFARVLQPITILSSLPLSIGGAVAALALTHHSVSLGVMIGFLMLMGIVAKNSILLVDFAIEEMRAGKDRASAIFEAGHKRAVHCHDDRRHGRRHAAGGDRTRRRRGVPRTHGDRRHRRTHHLYGSHAGHRPAAFSLIDDIERWLGPKFGRVLIAPPPRGHSALTASSGRVGNVESGFVRHRS